MIVNWLSVNGKGYRLEWSTDMITWIPGTQVAGTGALVEDSLNLSNLNLTNTSQIYVRVAISTPQ